MRACLSPRVRGCVMVRSRAGRGARCFVIRREFGAFFGAQLFIFIISRQQVSKVQNNDLISYESMILYKM